jgi:hypothetical protein
MTYDELLYTINDFVIRPDAPIESFIRRAETYLRTVTKHYLAEKSLVLPVVSGTVLLPLDFIEIRVITGKKLYKPVAVQAATLFDGEIGYYREGNKLVLVGEEPDATVSVLYWAAFPDLTSSQTNWLFDRHPNVYVAAILKEFHRWQTNAEGVQIEAQALQEALAIVAEDDRRGRQSGPLILGAATWQ